MMLSLFGRDEYALLGFAAILDGEKIPYERITNLAPSVDRVLVVVSPDLSDDESDRVAQMPSLVIGGGRRFVGRVFGRDAHRADRTCSIRLDESIWPPSVCALAGRFGKSFLRIPHVPLWEVEGGAMESMFAAVTHGPGVSTRVPAVARRNGCWWSSIDLGAAFANLLTERYLAPQNGSLDRLQSNASARRLAETAYYLAPDFVRRRLREHSSMALRRRLQKRGDSASEYPIDPTGWLVVELVKELLRRVGRPLVRLNHWPVPFRSAALLTHDLEPRRYAYRHGYPRLARKLRALASTSAFGIVARSSKHLKPISLRELAEHDVLCHGLTHRGETVDGRRRVASRLALARQTLERRLQRPVNGYRSPRLDRSQDLLWALDQQGFDYDSSYPDVDRENITCFGGGVRLNMPFRAPIEDEPGRWRASRCLELPLTAPDCIQPLFLGADVDALRDAVQRKAAFVRETGGLHVALVHAGVFGDEDANLREQHLDFVHQQLSHPETWLTTPSRLVEWWKARESLQIDVTSDIVTVRNAGHGIVAGACVVVDREERTTSIVLPQLLPGESTIVSMDESQEVKIQKANINGQNSGPGRAEMGRA